MMAEVAGYSGVTADGAGYTGVVPFTGSTPAAGYTGATSSGSGHTGTVLFSPSARGGDSTAVGYTGIADGGGGYTGVVSTSTADIGPEGAPAAAGYTGVTAEGYGYTGAAQVHQPGYEGLVATGNDGSDGWALTSDAASFEYQELAQYQTGWFGGYDTELMAKDLAHSIDGGDTRRLVGLVRLMDELRGPDTSIDIALSDFAADLANAASPDSLRSLSSSSDGRITALRLVKSLQSGYTTERENNAVNTLRDSALPQHRHLAGAPWSRNPSITSALEQSGSSIQAIREDGGETTYDEYRVSFNQMPSDLSARDFLAEMARDLNGAVNDGYFNAVNTFARRDAGTEPAIGDIYDIDIPVKSGSVMLVETSPNAFTFQTIKTRLLGSHPESGVREFGYEIEPDGRTVFYTRGVSQPTGLVRVGQAFAAEAQDFGWTRMIKGIGQELFRRGAKLSDRPYSSVTTSK